MDTLKELNIRDDFEALKQKMHNHPLIYFDNAATTFKPKYVIDTITDFYTHNYATVNRSVYKRSEKVGAQYHKSRQILASFINACHEETVFTAGATMGLNLIAHSYGDANLQEGDEILITELEHHSNLIPWQLLANRKKAVLKFIPTNQNGEIDLLAFKQLLNSSTKIVSLAHVSNVTGVIHPIKELGQLVHSCSRAAFVVDGAQAVSHLKVDVKDLGVDFYVFSAHKMYGPTGVGVLYGKKEILEKMPPFFGGGDMIDQVNLSSASYNQLPFKFEAGTPNIAGALGMGACATYLLEIGFESILEHEQKLWEYALKKLQEIPKLRILSNASLRSSLISFDVEGVHALDLSTLLNFKGVALRSGHLCAQTALKKFGVSSLLRISFAIYNTTEEIDQMIIYLKECLEKLY